MRTRNRQRSATDGNTTQRRVCHGHLGAAQLGTCDEAGGAPMTPQQTKFTRANEAASEQVRDTIRGRATHPSAEHAFSGAIAAIGGIAALGIWAFP